jgi:hypothetical protein
MTRIPRHTKIHPHGDQIIAKFLAVLLFSRHSVLLVRFIGERRKASYIYSLPPLNDIFIFI